MSFKYTSDYSEIESVTAYYSVTTSGEYLSEKGTGSYKMTGEQYMQNPSPMQIAELIKQKRSGAEQ